MLLLVSVLISFAAALEPLSSQPHIQCSACLAVAEHVGGKMNESAKLKSTFQASHRFDARNKVKRIDYESSELRAYEILDGVCNDFEKEFTLRLGENELRRFSNNKSLSRADYYGKNDKRELRSISKRMKDICMEITEEQDDIIIKLIKKERDLATLQQKLCYAEGFKCCGTKSVEASKLKERQRRAKWLELKRERDAKRKAGDESARKQKEVEEELNKKKHDPPTESEPATEAATTEQNDAPEDL